MGILKEIVDKKREKVDSAMSRTPVSELKERAGDTSAPRPFDSSLIRGGEDEIKVIAEIKKASPSKGLIRKDLDPASIGRIYESCGASAISVLTEEDHFMGDIGYLKEVKEATSIPVLRKDFIIDEYQIFEARAYEADAILLIAAILERGQADEYIHIAKELGLSVLFEAHNLKELDMILGVGATVVGINNRDLDTLEIDLNTTLDMIKDIPDDRTIVTESGISERKDVEIFSRSRVDAILIGTALMKENDISARYRELFG
ncbi:MAG: indole-3-glycerol phosphate synthase TrpC [Nitrospirota bacterium]|nr:MAG: indole-3-glycerol phosphate synthase TrpC [Nitrospirota bacterium]